MVVVLRIRVCLGVLLAVSGGAWDLGLLARTVRHVSLVGPRAFLSVDPLEGGYHTLLVAPWPEPPTLLPALALAFAHVKPYPTKDHQVLGNCSGPQAAVASAWDGLGLRLVVLDAGSSAAPVHAHCPAKILSYNLVTNKLTGSTELAGVPGSGLASLVLDPGMDRVYVAEPAPGCLLVVELASGRSWTPRLSPAPASSISQLALLGTRLYLSSRSTDDLYTLDLSLLRHVPKSRSNNVTEDGLPEDLLQSEHGALLGVPSGLAAHRHWLYYWMARDYALLRWDSRQPLRAEGHEVLLQSAELLGGPPRQLFLDPQRQLWALAEPRPGDRNATHCVRLTRPQL